MSFNNYEMYSAPATEQIPPITIDESGESVEEKEDLFSEFFYTERTVSNSVPNPVLQQATEMNITPQRELVHYNTNQQAMHHPVPEDDPDCLIVYDSELQQDAHQGEGLQSVPDREHAMNEYVDLDVFNAQQVEQYDSYEYVNGVPQGTDFQAAEYEMVTAGGPVKRPRRRNPPTSDPFSAKRKARSKNYKYAPEESSRDLPLVDVDGKTILTENVAQRLAYELAFRGLAQGFFAERVLGIKQSGLSELIVEPKKTMRTKGWIKYKKLIAWLEMSEEDKFKVLRREIVFCETEEESEPVPEPDQENMSAENAQKEKKTKKARTQFTPDQLTALQANYKRNQYPTKEEKKKLAIQLNLPFQSVDNWFVNTRRRNPVVAPEQPAK